MLLLNDVTVVGDFVWNSHAIETPQSSIMSISTCSLGISELYCKNQGILRLGK